jgi:hypothetical protein
MNLVGLQVTERRINSFRTNFVYRERAHRLQRITIAFVRIPITASYRFGELKNRLPHK